jgi:hypothetical protein
MASFDADRRISQDEPSSALGTEPRCESLTGGAAFDGEAAVRRTRELFMLMSQFGHQPVAE